MDSKTMKNYPYLRKLQYEIPYAGNSSIENRYRTQDNLIASSLADQDALSTVKRDIASAESSLYARYGIALVQYQNFLTGYPDILKLHSDTPLFVSPQGGGTIEYPR
jgi:hypothetical protein